MLLAAVAAGGGGGADARQRIAVEESVREQVLAEMRTMLASLDGLLRALAAEDRASAVKAARAAGMATAVDVDPHVERDLPEAFRALGVATHQGFDALAERIEGGASSQEVLGELAKLSANCVACHQAFRLGAAP
jgi:cytochrome c556